MAAAAAAASSIALRCSDGKAFLRGESRLEGGDPRSCQLHLRRPCSKPRAAMTAVVIPVQQNIGNLGASTLEPCARRFAIDADRAKREKRQEEEKDEEGRGSGAEKLDEWMRGSVAEIVKSIGEAPFLVHVFAGNGEAAGLRLQREAADAESWPHIRRRWSTGAALPPDGVILVEELEEGEDQHGREGEEATEESGDEGASCSSGGSSSSSSSSSKTWGVLVQGRGAEGAACYILNTCRVRSSFGFCTHFCLARAKCFGETADVQLKKAWLLGRKHGSQQ